MALSHHLTQGGQTFLHRFRMLKQILWLASWLSLTAACLTFVMLSVYTVPMVLWLGSYRYYEDQLVHQMSSLKHQSYHRKPSSQRALWRYQHALCYRHCQRNAILALGVGFLLYPLLFVFWRRKGQKDKQSQLLKGTFVAPWSTVRQILHEQDQASSLHLVDLPLVKDTETQHMMISGTTGSGKTTCFHHLLPQIRHQQAVIVDTTGEFVDRYYRPHDIMLNPYDARSRSWHMWGECHADYHWHEIAENLVPHNSHDPFWTDAARIVLTEAMKKGQSHQSMDKLTTLLQKAPLEKLYQALKDTPAASVIDPTSEKTAASIRTTLSTALRCLSLLPDTTTPFSIRQWMQTPSSQWLFLTMLPEQRAALRPLVSTWVSVAMKALMGNTYHHSDRRVWFILDELPSLQKLRDLTLCLSEGRKYGACMILGLQNIPQLETYYGPHITKSIIDLCATKVFLRMAGFDVAQRMSASLGQKDIMEVQEGLSYGANDVRDGVNLSLHRRTEPVVSPYDLLSLKPLEAYVQLPGPYPITKIVLPSPGAR